MEVIAGSEHEKQEATEVFPVEMDKAVEEKGKDKYDLQLVEGHSEEVELAGSQAPQAPKEMGVKRQEEESKEVRPEHRPEDAQEARPHDRPEEREASSHDSLEDEEAQGASSHNSLEDEEAQGASAHDSLEDEEAQEASAHDSLEDEEAQGASSHDSLEEEEAQEASTQDRPEEGSKDTSTHDVMQEGNEEQLDENGLRVLWQVGDQSAKNLSTLMHSNIMRQGSSGEPQQEDLESSDQELDWESSMEEQDLHPLNIKSALDRSWLPGWPEERGGQQQVPFEELLSDLQRENQNLRTLCLTLTREKTHLARTLLEMRKEAQSSSQENLSLKLQLDALREDKRLGLKTGKSLQNIHDMTLEERAHIAEQQAAQVEAQLMALTERYNRIERDNQVMADEIHNFREEVGRLRQCPVRNNRRCFSTRTIFFGTFLLIALFYYMYLTKDVILY